MNEYPRARRMLNLEQVLELVPVSRSNLLKMEKDGIFPRGVFISPNRKVWFEDDVCQWQEDRLKEPSIARKVRRRKKSAGLNRPGPV